VNVGLLLQEQNFSTTDISHTFCHSAILLGSGQSKLGIDPGHIVLDGDPVPSPPKKGTAPSFWTMSIVAKWSPISATAEHLLLQLSSSSQHFN